MTGMLSAASSPSTRSTQSTRDDRVAGISAELRGLARRRRLQRTAIVSALALTTVCLVVVQVHLTGSADIPTADVLPAAFGLRDGLADYVIHETRMPRALTAVLAGALFGLSGALYQRLIGNPLATPDVIGVSSGASAGAMLAIGGLAARGPGVQVAALTGAVLAAVLVYGLSWGRGVQTYRLILVGIGVGACGAAVTTFFLTSFDSVSSQRAMQWLVGSLNGSRWDGVTILSVALIVATVFSLLVRRSLSDLGLGDELATGVGVRVPLVRLGTLLAGAVIAAIVTSIVGPIAFIALVSGPIAARLMRTPDAPLAAALVGALLLAVSDIAAQTLPGIAPIPTGALTAVLGAPALIALLLRRKATV